MLKINIVRGAKDQDPITKQITFQEARKAVNGDLLIFDHDLIDIVVSPEKLKISTFPKTTVTEETYSTQEGLLQKLSKVGVNELPETLVVPSYSLDNVTLRVLGTTVTFIVAPVNV